MLGGRCPRATVGTEQYVPRVDFTALHRAPGYPPAVLTDEVPADVVNQGGVQHLQLSSRPHATGADPAGT